MQNNNNYFNHQNYFSYFSVICGEFVRLFVASLFGCLWRVFSVICGGFVRLLVAGLFGYLWRACYFGHYETLRRIYFEFTI